MKIDQISAYLKLCQTLTLENWPRSCLHDRKVCACVYILVCLLKERISIHAKSQDTFRGHVYSSDITDFDLVFWVSIWKITCTILYIQNSRPVPFSTHKSTNSSWENISFRCCLHLKNAFHIEIYGKITCFQW